MQHVFILFFLLNLRVVVKAKNLCPAPGFAFRPTAECSLAPQFGLLAGVNVFSCWDPELNRSH